MRTNPGRHGNRSISIRRLPEPQREGQARGERPRRALETGRHSSEAKAARRHVWQGHIALSQPAEQEVSLHSPVARQERPGSPEAEVRELLAADEIFAAF